MDGFLLWWICISVDVESQIGVGYSVDYSMPKLTMAVGTDTVLGGGVSGRLLSQFYLLWVVFFFFFSVLSNMCCLMDDYLDKI